MRAHVCFILVSTESLVTVKWIKQSREFLYQNHWCTGSAVPLGLFLCMLVCFGVLHWSDIRFSFYLFIYFLFGFNFTNTPVCTSVYLIFFIKIWVYVKSLGSLWCHCVCMCTATPISISWHLSENICTEVLTSGSHIFSHHCCSHWKWVHRRENERGGKRKGSI